MWGFQKSTLFCKVRLPRASVWACKLEIDHILQTEATKAKAWGHANLKSTLFCKLRLSRPRRGRGGRGHAFVKSTVYGKLRLFRPKTRLSCTHWAAKINAFLQTEAISPQAMHILLHARCHHACPRQGHIHPNHATAHFYRNFPAQ